MKMPRARLVIAAFALLAAVAAAVGVVSWVHVEGMGTADAVLRRADDLAWNDRWVEAEPLFKNSELLYSRQDRRSKALYAHVSQIPANAESSSLGRTISELTQDLARPESQDPETRLRILEIRGMMEVNYDARLARATWAQVAELATRQHHFLLASRAAGEQGIAAFMLGDIAQAKRRVIAAWTVSRLVHDSAAHVRYASLYGAGLCELHRYQEALTPLDDAINTAVKDPLVGYPSLAINSKVDALRGLGHYQEALALANQALGRIPNRSLKGHYYQILSTRGSVYEDLGDPSRAISDYQEALDDAAQLDLWRGISEVGGRLALVYEHQGKLQQALEAINRAIDANTQIPDELYLVPRNLAIKAAILERMGEKSESDALYQKSAALIDSLLDHAPTPNVERLLLAELSEVYSGYFASMCGEHQYDKALGILEAARGRVEAQALQHHTYLEPHQVTADEQRLTNLNLALINTNNPAQRDELIHKIYETELSLDSRSLEGITATQPVRLVQLQRDLAPNEVLIRWGGMVSGWKSRCLFG
jgi:tetratricopeptide (TPR) repeat protein